MKVILCSYEKASSLHQTVAFGTSDIFLRLNGYRIKVDAGEGQEFIVKIATGTVDETVVRKWVSQNLKKL